MKRRVRIVVVLASVLALMTINVGVASADHGTDAHGNDAPAFQPADDNNVSPPADASLTPGAAPVGSHILGDVPGHPGADNGFGRLHEADGSEIPGGPGTNFDNPAVIALFNNPNCPLHYLP